MRELFIYYRVLTTRADEAQAAVGVLHRQLRSTFPGLEARLYKRTAAGETQTWMETYALRQPASEGITPAIEADIADAARPLLALIEGARHTEAFVPCAS